MSQQINIKDAIIRLTEDLSLTDEVADDTAQTLIDWGIMKLRALAQTAPNNLLFEVNFRQLRLLIKSINRFTARRFELDIDEQRDYVRAILDAARQLGYQAPYGQVGAFTAQQESLDEDATVRSLLALVDSGSSDEPGPAGPFLR
jgi:hypothetical protein